MALLEFQDHFVNQFETFHDQLFALGPCDHDFARDKDKEGDLRVFHPINQPRKHLWLVLNFILPPGTNCMIIQNLIGQLKFVEMDGEFDIRRSNNVLNLQCPAGVRTLVPNDLVDDFCVFPCCEGTFLLGFGSCHYHFARPEDQRCGLGLLKPHYDGSKAAGIILCIFGFPINVSEFELTAE